MTGANVVEMTYSGDRSPGNLTPQMPSGKRYPYGGASGVIQVDPRDVATLERLQFQERVADQDPAPEPEAEVEAQTQDAPEPEPAPEIAPADDTADTTTGRRAGRPRKSDSE